MNRVAELTERQKIETVKAARQMPKDLISGDPDVATPFEHVTVLLEETISGILPSDKLAENIKKEQKPFVFVDTTLGGAGHALHFFKMFRSQPFFDAQTRLEFVGFDRDPAAMAVSAQRIQSFLNAEGLAEQVTFVPAAMNFQNAPEFLTQRYGKFGVHGLYGDFGVSSPQLDHAERGFSIQRSGPLDMRMDTGQKITALDILQTETEENLSRIFFEYGEEPRARKLAKAIVGDRAVGKLRVSNTVEFADYVRAVLCYHGSKVHPATRVFQALRIAVNGELDAIEALLDGTFRVVSPFGKAGFISFHSLEDRLVKQRFRAWQEGKSKPDEGKRNYEMERYLEKTSWGKEVPRGGTVASELESKQNPRARSARLRIFEFLEENIRKDV